MKKTAVLLLLVSFVCISATQFIHPAFFVPKGWPDPVYSFEKNELSDAKILLGRALFYDPVLSENNIISCSSCHLQYTAFAHVDHKLSHGIYDSIGTRNAPALVNLAWHSSFMWDGAVNHLDMQPLAPISNPAEMGSNIESVAARLNNKDVYPDLFDKAFGDTLITGERILKAISAFMVTIISCDSKYDMVMRGETSFDKQEASGYKIFQKNCVTCHAEPLFTSLKFESNGLPLDPLLNDIGRMKVTGKASDARLFKVPTLRNIEFSYPYMHDGRFSSIRQVLDHYNTQANSVIKNKISLTSSEKVDLTAFLLTLTDKKFLFNTEYSFPKEVLLKR